MPVSNVSIGNSELPICRRDRYVYLNTNFIIYTYLSHPGVLKMYKSPKNLQPFLDFHFFI